jgi:hypothetical protein
MLPSASRAPPRPWRQLFQCNSVSCSIRRRRRSKPSRRARPVAVRGHPRSIYARIDFTGIRKFITNINQRRHCRSIRSDERYFSRHKISRYLRLSHAERCVRRTAPVKVQCYQISNSAPCPPTLSLSSRIPSSPPSRPATGSTVMDGPGNFRKASRNYQITEHRPLQTE